MNYGRRATDRHADLRIDAESASELLIDALDGYIAGTLSRPVMIRALEHARVAWHRVQRYEAAIDMRLPRRRFAIADLLLAAEVAGDVEEGNGNGAAAYRPDPTVMVQSRSIGNLSPDAPAARCAESRQTVTRHAGNNQTHDRFDCACNGGAT